MMLSLVCMDIIGIMITANAHIGGGVKCFDRKYIDGEDHLFNQLADDKCSDDLLSRIH